MNKLRYSVPTKKRVLEHYAQPDWSSQRVRTFVSGTCIFGFRYTDVNKIVMCGSVMPDWERAMPCWASKHFWRVYRSAGAREQWCKALVEVGGKEIETWRP